MIARLVKSRTLGQSFAFSTALLVIVVVGATLVVVESRVAASLRAGLESRGLSIARSIGAVATPSLLAYNYPALQIAAAGAAEDRDLVYVVIHDREGAVAGVAGRPGAVAAAATRLSEIPREPRSFDVEIEEPGERRQALEVAVPVRVEDVEEPWGMVRVGLSFEPMKAQLRSLIGNMVALGMTLVLGAVASGIWLARRITAPLRGLAKGTEAVSAGDMTHRIPVRGARELAELARAFNVMMDRVQEKACESSEFQRALERLNTTLEEQVRERTRALEESEAQYKTLVEHSPNVILILQGGKIRFVNRWFVETFGVPEEEVLDAGFELGRIFEPASADLARERTAAWERGESPGPVEVRGQDAAGRTRHLELRGSRIEYRGLPASECLLIDTTEARRLHERLVEAEKLRALGELAGGVAHDFNNLLGAVLGRVQLLRRRAFDPTVDRDLAVIEKAAQDGRETIRRIQEFSRTRRDKKFVPLDLAEILTDSVEITKTRWKSDAERRNVSIQVDVKVGAIPPVMGSAAELREVFTNLILNAVDAMPQGGTLALKCRADGDTVVAEVSDTGVGMTEEIRRQLFDPFFTTKGAKGMGLGMSVVYGIVTRHEGKIEVSTELGKGTAFVLEFPAAPVSALAGRTAAAAAAAPEPPRPGRILVIDDEPDVAEVVRDVLAAEGHNVDTAVSGADGIQLAMVSAYDMVLTDLGMPDMSGWEVAERLGALYPGLPVALVTGWGTILDEDEVRQRGIAAVVHKPFDIADLLRATSEVLSAARA